MRVLGVVGSPRRQGNTALLVSRALDGARDGGAEVDELVLCDLAIRECDGCHVCWQGKECSKQDDMNGVYPRIAEADAFVFGTPVYWYGPTALMKGFIDRFVYFNCPENRVKVGGKRAGIVVPHEEDDPAAAQPVVEFFERCLDYLEVDLVGNVTVPGVTRKGEVAEREQAMQAAYELGRVLMKGPG